MESKELEVVSGRPPMVSDGRREILLTKLEAFKINNLTAKEKELTDTHTEKFAYSFIAMCYILEGISRVQLRKLEKDDLIELEKLISGRVAIRARLWKTLGFSVPIFGWFFIFLSWIDDDRPLSWSYIYSKKKLRKVYGKNYFPYDAIENKLL